MISTDSGNTSSLEVSSPSGWVLPEALQYLIDEGDHDAIAAILCKFKSDTRSRLQLLRGAVENANAREIRSQAHAINGNARLVGAETIVSVCRQLEIDAENGEAAALIRLVELIDERFCAVCQSVDQAIAQAELDRSH